VPEREKVPGDLYTFKNETGRKETSPLSSRRGKALPTSLLFRLEEQVEAHLRPRRLRSLRTPGPTRQQNNLENAEGKRDSRTTDKHLLEHQVHNLRTKILKKRRGGDFEVVLGGVVQKKFLASKDTASGGVYVLPCSGKWEIPQLRGASV